MESEPPAVADGALAVALALALPVTACRGALAFTRPNNATHKVRRRLPQYVLLPSGILALRKHLFHPLQILFRIHPHSIEGRFGHVNLNAVVEKSQLFQAFAAF